MKKILLSIASVALCIPSLFATDYTIAMKGTSYSYNDPANTTGEFDGSSVTAPTGATVLTFTKDGFTFVCDKNPDGTGAEGKGTNTPVFNQPDELRLYANNILTITAPEGQKITAVDFVLSSDGIAKQAKITVDAGTIGTQTKGSGNVTWSGEVGTIKFTIGKTASFGTKSGAGRLCFTSVKISTVADGEATKAQPELKFEPASITVDLGAEFTQPVFSAAEGVDKSLITFTTSDEAVAKYTAEGGLELVGIGTATITAEFPGNDDFYKDTAELAVIVKDPNLLLETNGQEFTFDNPADIAVWSYDSKNNYLKGSAYKSGKVNEATAYAVSPVIDLTEKESAVLSFDNRFNMYMLNNVLIDVADFPGKYAFVVVREEGATEWTVLCEPKAPTIFDWAPYANGPIDLSAYAGKKIQFGFKYVSTADVAGTWEVENIKLTATDKQLEAPAVPVVRVNGEIPTGDVKFTEGEYMEVTFDLVENVEIYFKLVPSRLTDYSLYEGSYFSVSESSTLYYYAKGLGGESAVTELAFIAEPAQPGQTLPDGIEISPAPGNITSFPEKITLTFTKEAELSIFKLEYPDKVTITTPSNETVDATIGSYNMFTSEAQFEVSAADMPKLTADGKYNVMIPLDQIFNLEGASHTYPSQLTFYYNLNTSSAVEGVDAAENTVYNVYDLNGRIVRRNAADLNGLDKGVYIVNGKKVLVK